jgi:hypothetical protein
MSRNGFIVVFLVVAAGAVSSPDFANSGQPMPKDGNDVETVDEPKANGWAKLLDDVPALSIEGALYRDKEGNVIGASFCGWSENQRYRIRRGYSKADHALTMLKEYPGVRFVVLQDSDVTDDGLRILQSFERLERVDLDGTDITDAGLAHLTEVKTLRVVEMVATKATPTGAAELRRALPAADVRTPKMGVWIIPPDEIHVPRKQLDGLPLKSGRSDTLLPDVQETTPMP